MTHIHLIVPTVTEFNCLGRVEPLKAFGLTFSQSFITNGPASIESEFDELFAAPDVLILGCVGFHGLDRRLEVGLREKGHDVPVIDALPLTILTAATLVRTGLRHSKNAYPYPPQKRYVGYVFPERKN